MKAAFLTSFAVLVLLSLWAVSHIPAPAPPGRTVLTWVTDPAPVRLEQMRLFREYARTHGRPDIDIRLDPNNSGPDKIVVQAVGGIGPDVFDMYQRDQLYAYQDAGILRDVTDMAKKRGFSLDAMWPAIKAAATIDGRQYSVPPNCCPSVLFYNKAVFDRLGIPYPKGDWTWEQFVATAKRLTVKRGNGRGYESFGVMNYSLDECLWQAGARYYSPDGLVCTLDSPEAIEGARFFYNLQHTYHVMPTASEESAMSSAGGWGTESLNHFMSGHIGMFVSGRFAMLNFRNVPGLRVGVAPMPFHRQHANHLLWKSTGINNRSPRQEAALMFLRFLTTKPFCREINASGDGVSAMPRYDNTPEFLHDATHPDETDNGLWLTEMKYAKDLEVSSYVNPFVVSRITNDQRDLLRDGSITPEQAMRTAARKVNALIHKNIEKDPIVRQRYLQRMPASGSSQ